MRTVVELVGRIGLGFDGRERVEHTQVGAVAGGELDATHLSDSGHVCNKHVARFTRRLRRG